MSICVNNHGRTRRGCRAACTAILAAVCLAGATAPAAGELRTTLEQEEFVLVNNINLEYNQCLEDKAAARIETQEPVRDIMQQAVDECSSVLEDLVKEFDRRGIDPNYYQGIIRHLKSGAVRRQLPVLMMRKANPEQNLEQPQPAAPGTE